MRAALQCGALLLVGTAVWKFLIERRARAAPAAGIQGPWAAARGVLNRRVAWLAALTAFALIPVWLLRFHIQLRDFRDPFVPVGEDIRFLLRETVFGPVWLVQGAVIFVLAAVLAWLGWHVTVIDPDQLSPTRGDSPLWWVVAFAALALALTLSLSSHALSVEENRSVAVAADFLHTLAAGGWIGSLALVLATARIPEIERHGLFGAQLRFFSPVAVVAVVTLVTMGTYLGWEYLDSVADLWLTPYGRVLAAKVATAGIVLFMGFVNWRRGMPSVDSPDVRAVIAKRAAWEVCVAGVVLLLTGVLTGTPH